MIAPLPVWQDVHAALLVGLPTLPAMADAVVYDGEPITAETADRITIGYVTDDGAGTFQQVPDPSGFATVESGDVRCWIACNAGDSDPSITRNRAFALFAAWQQWLFNNPTFDGRVPNCQVVNLSAQVHAAENAMGSGAGLLVTVTYQATVFVS